MMIEDYITLYKLMYLTDNSKIVLNSHLNLNDWLLDFEDKTGKTVSLKIVKHGKSFQLNTFILSNVSIESLIYWAIDEISYIHRLWNKNEK